MSAEQNVLVWNYICGSSTLSHNLSAHPKSLCLAVKHNDDDGCCCPGQVLCKTMLKPLVMYPSLSVTVTEQQDEGITLALQCLEESHDERSTPSQVYSKLLLVLKTLHTHLLGTV